MSKYNDTQRINALNGWALWTEEIRAAVDAEIEKYRAAHANDETQCCLDCSSPLVPCRHGTCSGGNCFECS